MSRWIGKLINKLQTEPSLPEGEPYMICLQKYTLSTIHVLLALGRCMLKPCRNMLWFILALLAFPSWERIKHELFAELNSEYNSCIIRSEMNYETGSNHFPMYLGIDVYGHGKCVRAWWWMLNTAIGATTSRATSAGQPSNRDKCVSETCNPQIGDIPITVKLG